MQRLFAVCTKSIVPSVRAIGATNAVAIAKPLSFMQLALPEQSLTMRPLISGLMVYSQSLFDRFLDNGLIFVGRPRRMPKKANHGARPNSHVKRREKKPRHV
ncbi:hypothetical protein WA538_001773 [Blastocystis sp. DL]